MSLRKQGGRRGDGRRGIFTKLEVRLISTARGERRSSVSAENMFPCPCCGYLVHESVGSSMICPICRWEDDIAQFRWPTYRGGANRTDLVEAQGNFELFGASNSKAVPRARDPRETELRDVGFRSVDPAIDNLESPEDQVADWQDDSSALYWWRPDYWRRRLLPHKSGGRHGPAGSAAEQQMAVVGQLRSFARKGSRRRMDSVGPVQ